MKHIGFDESTVLNEFAKIAYEQGMVKTAEENMIELGQPIIGNQPQEDTMIMPPDAKETLIKLDAATGNTNDFVGMLSAPYNLADPKSMQKLYTKLGLLTKARAQHGADPDGFLLALKQIKNNLFSGKTPPKLTRDMEPSEQRYYLAYQKAAKTFGQLMGQPAQKAEDDMFGMMPATAETTLNQLDEATGKKHDFIGLLSAKYNYANPADMQKLYQKLALLVQAGKKHNAAQGVLDVLNKVKNNLLGGATPPKLTRDMEPSQQKQYLAYQNAMKMFGQLTGQPAQADDAADGRFASRDDDGFIVVNAKEDSKKYDVTGETGEQLVEKAHPGGGTKTELTHSKTDENLVETIVEQQKKDIEVAKSVPKGTYAELMRLHNALSKMGYKEHLGELESIISSVATTEEVVNYTLQNVSDKFKTMGYNKSAAIVGNMLKKKVAEDYMDPGIAEYGGSWPLEPAPMTGPTGTSEPIDTGLEVEPAGKPGGAPPPKPPSQNQRVKQWQMYYNKAIEGTGLSPLAVDGIKGPKTRAAMQDVRQYGSLKAFRDAMYLPLEPIPTGPRNPDSLYGTLKSMMNEKFPGFDFEGQAPDVKSYLESEAKRMAGTQQDYSPAEVDAQLQGIVDKVTAEDIRALMGFKGASRKFSKKAQDYVDPGIAEYGGSWPGQDVGMTGPTGTSESIPTGKEYEPAGKPGAAPPAPPKPNKRSQRKAKVMNWQKMFNSAIKDVHKGNRFITPLAVDGIIGPKTRAAMARVKSMGGMQGFKAKMQDELMRQQQKAPQKQQPQRRDPGAKTQSPPMPPPPPPPPSPQLGGKQPVMPDISKRQKGTTPEANRQRAYQDVQLNNAIRRMVLQKKLNPAQSGKIKAEVLKQMNQGKTMSDALKAVENNVLKSASKRMSKKKKSS